MNPDYIFLELLNIVALREKAATDEWYWVQKLSRGSLSTIDCGAAANERQGSKNCRLGHH